MKFGRSVFFACIALLTTGCTNQKFKTEEPVDYKDNAKFGFGSLIKGEDATLRKYFLKNSTKENELTVEKVRADSSRDHIWNSALAILQDFPLEFMDKQSGKIETEKVRVKMFDTTETCTYKIRIKIINEKDVDVVVSSDEDSKPRLKKHAETIRSKILEASRK